MAHIDGPRRDADGRAADRRRYLGRRLTQISSDVSGTSAAVDDHTDLSLLFHRLNNQLGIILANAELLEAKSSDDMGRARAAQVVASVLDAMATARAIRQQTR
jgi:hypothetical protein